MKMTNLLFILLLSGFLVETHAATITKCQDSNGKVLYTEDPSDCYSEKEVLSFAVKEKILSEKERISYRVPQRNYIQEPGKWRIYVEASMHKGNSKLYRESVDTLKNVIDKLFSTIPAHAAQQLESLKFYLMWGEASPDGGRKSGMSYIRKGEPENYLYLDSQWEHSIVVYSAKNLIYLNGLWAKKALMHELAHAWHITNWPQRYPPIYSAWKNAKQQRLYLNVNEVKGGKIDKAYALKNQLEYFAELSAIYFVGGNYFPYDKNRLANYDPQGLKMVETLWF